tara:strand:+ start:339 stop:1103 length:765 start_codon:yes stop_codon:yes gene_type:complete
MTQAAYIPSGGLTGKIKRQAARRLARAPLSIPSGTRIVSFTFDDFPKSAVEQGASALEYHGWRGTWYAAMGFAGGSNHHGPLFDAGDINRLADAGHEIACHTHSHGDGASAPLTVTLDDVRRNTEALEGLGVQIDNFAYPYGEATPALKAALAKRYQSMRGVQPGINQDRADRRLLKAVGIDGGDSGVATARRYLEGLQQDGGWLIYYIHDVQETPTEWGCTPEQLEDVLEAVKQSGADVRTIRDAMTAFTATS